MGLSVSDENDPFSLPQDAARVTCFQIEALKPHSQLQVPFLSVCLPLLSALLADQQVRICLSGIFPTGSGWDEL